MKLTNPLNWTVTIRALLIAGLLVAAAIELYYLHTTTTILLSAVSVLMGFIDYGTGTYL